MIDGEKEIGEEAGVQCSYYAGFFSEDQDEEECLTWANTGCANYLTRAFV